MHLEWEKLGGPAVEGRFSKHPVSASNAPIRPPWSWDDKEFLAACTQCDACVKACPGKIIVRGSDGFPQVDFARGECTFCGDCVSACTPGALVRAHQGSTPWLLKASITQDCLTYKQVSCFSCGDTCSRRAIRFESREGKIPIPKVDRRLCKGCGACLAWCSVSAIMVSSAAETKPRVRATQAALPR